MYIIIVGACVVVDCHDCLDLILCDRMIDWSLCDKVDPWLQNDMYVDYQNYLTELYASLNAYFYDGTLEGGKYTIR